jgi:hypothetical protein
MSYIEEDSTVETPSKRKCIYIPKDDIKKPYIPSDLNLCTQFCTQSFVENDDNNFYDNNNDGIDDDMNNEIVNSDSEDFENNVDDNFDDEIVEQVEFERENNELFREGLILKVINESNLTYSPLEPVYDGSIISMKHLCRYLLCLKTAIGAGDYAFTCIVGSIIAFLPNSNIFKLSLGQNCSSFKMLNTIYYFADINQNLKTYKFNICDNGTCVNKQIGVDSCGHGLTKLKKFHYMPIRQRMEYLLNSDIRNLFMYPLYKYRSPKVYDINYFFC